MADILIKGVNMPRNCWECRVSAQYEVVEGMTLACLITMKTKERDDKPIPDWCPLIELPPHGRLIDADALDVNFGWLDEAKGYKTHITFVYSNDIDRAPTVIEASEVE